MEDSFVRTINAKTYAVNVADGRYVRMGKLGPYAPNAPYATYTCARNMQ